MSLSRKLRNIALSQIGAIQDRLNRIDAEAALEAERKIEQRRVERDAREELDDPMQIKPTLRSPEDIAAGVVRPSAAPGGPASRPSSYRGSETVSQPTAPMNPGPAPQAGSQAALHLHYRVLGLEDGADFAAVQSTYNKLAARCDPTRFPEGTEDRKMAEGIKNRVDAAYQSLRDALDSTAGRFDKLELE
jgi:hypothetical protein